MKLQKLLFAVAALLVAFAGYSQTRDCNLTITVKSETGESLAGTVISLRQTDYGLSYENLVLDSEGKWTSKVYAGKHNLTIEKTGYKKYSEDFEVAGDMEKVVTIGLEIREPFSLVASVDHDAYTGKNDVVFSWNKEKPVFSDDFDSYEAFALTFGGWTGIDGDLQAAAPLQGNYPNRGALQYAQIINPIDVGWWNDYPVLRPYSGNQYVGFIRTNSGSANDDWLITPAITVGTDNVVSFMAKAADVSKERFEVGITTKENPTAGDFEIISSGNYEEVGYESWRTMSYDLSKYTGETVKIAIHYISDAARYGAFMLMVDDFYVGQQNYDETRAKRVASKSPANPYERFYVYKNGAKVGETDGYSYRFEDVAAGTYEFGVQSVYTSGNMSAIVNVDLAVSNDGYSPLSFNVATNNGVSPDGLSVQLVNKATAETYRAEIVEGKAGIKSLPNGTYLASIESDMFEAYEIEIALDGEKTVNVDLKEKIITPYNITGDVTENGGGNYDVVLKWNQDLGFSDSFETYDDFASGSFGGWKTVDLDQHICYPIALGSASNIITFPGASTTNDPKAILPMVFNPYKTSPAMAPSDPAILAPDGDKTVIFFSPQQNTADKWLISPQQTIRDGYIMRVTAKAYTTYPESLEFCISTTDDEPASFTAIAKVASLPSDEWTEYTVDLKDYAGQDVYLAVHYVSSDAMLAQVDEFYCGPEKQGSGMSVGNVEKYTIYLDGAEVGTATEATFELKDVAAGEHTVGIKATYKSGESEIGTLKINVQGGVADNFAEGSSVIGGVGEILVDSASKSQVEIYNLSGQILNNSFVGVGLNRISAVSGLYIVKFDGKTYKVAVK